MHLDKVTETANREWYLYLIQTAAGALYTGISTDVERRFTAHSRGQGAKALRGRGPLTLVFSRPVGDHANALRLEYRVKQLTRSRKRKLIDDQPIDIREWLAQLLPH